MKTKTYLHLYLALAATTAITSPLTTKDIVGDEHKNAGLAYQERNIENPPYITMQAVLDNDSNLKKGGWADPEDYPSDPDFKANTKKSFLGELKFDENGRPLNPMGETGINGRGWLGKWGVNLAADPIITRENPQSGNREMLAIRRKDNGMWAVPGGMVDDGDSVSTTLEKEFREEAGIELPKGFLGNAETIYEGYSDDPRNTNNAWIETVAKWKHLDPRNKVEKLIANMEPVAGDDAAKAEWKPCTADFANTTYASHPELIKEVVRRWGARY